MSDALADAQMEHIHLTYYLTSIYDHSIYEAFSKIIQKLIRELPTLENLLNVLCSVCHCCSSVCQPAHAKAVFHRIRVSTRLISSIP